MKVPFAIVDFINEVTSIPCVKNQLFLCKDTSYFHDFAQLKRNISAQINKKTLSQEDVTKLK